MRAGFAGFAQVKGVSLDDFAGTVIDADRAVAELTRSFWNYPE